jgi:prepilin-type processing-associated H-X9-DG protein
MLFMRIPILFVSLTVIILAIGTHTPSVADMSSKNMSSVNPVHFPVEYPAPNHSRHIHITVVGMDADFNAVKDFTALVDRVYPLQADLIADPLSGETPLSVTFTNKTNGLATSFNWAFGDGHVSHDENPVHQHSRNLFGNAHGF